MRSTADSKNTGKQSAKNQPRRESGQIVIFMAFLLIALVGMAGLAIDGGRLYFEYRDVQNATDAAIQAAVYAKCTGRDIIPAAFQAVEDNGLEIDHGTTVWVFSPPITGDAEGNDDYVEVVVTSTIDPYFIQVVYHDDLTVSARAVGICIPDKLANAFRGAMFSGAPCGACVNGLKVSGAAAEIVGGLHSNCDIQLGGGGQYTTVTGDVSLVSPSGNWSDDKVDFVDGPPQLGADPMPFAEYFDIKDFRPDPSVFASHGYAPPIEDQTGLGLIAREAMYNPDHPYNGPEYAYAGTVDATQYHVFECSNQNDKMDRTWLRNHNLLDHDNNMEPGLYYSACNISLSNMGDMAGVTMVAEGYIDVSGNDNFMSPYELSPALSLFSMDGGYACSTKAINLSGSHTEWHGILYAPQGEIVNSASDTDGYGAMIGWEVAATGSDSYVEWDDTLLPPTPPQIGVAE